MKNKKKKNRAGCRVTVHLSCAEGSVYCYLAFICAVARLMVINILCRNFIYIKYYIDISKIKPKEGKMQVM